MPIQFLVFIALLLEASLFSFPKIKAGEFIIEIIPGISLGGVKLGTNAIELESLGFKLDQLRVSDKFTFYEKPPLHARLANDSVVEIWVEDIGRLKDRLVYRGTPFPSELSEDSLSHYFHNCEAPELESGGDEIFCQNEGMRLTLSNIDANWVLGVLSDAKSFKWTKLGNQLN